MATPRPVPPTTKAPDRFRGPGPSSQPTGSTVSQSVTQCLVAGSEHLLPSSSGTQGADHDEGQGPHRQARSLRAVTSGDSCRNGGRLRHTDRAGHAALDLGRLGSAHRGGLAVRTPSLPAVPRLRWSPVVLSACTRQACPWPWPGPRPCWPRRSGWPGPGSTVRLLPPKRRSHPRQHRRTAREPPGALYVTLSPQFTVHSGCGQTTDVTVFTGSPFTLTVRVCVLPSANGPTSPLPLHFPSLSRLPCAIGSGCHRGRPRRRTRPIRGHVRPTLQRESRPTPTTWCK